MYFDPLYIMVFIVTLALAGITSLYVKSSFARYSKIPASSGMSGAEAANRMLEAAGLAQTVNIERVDGFLSDHYDPKANVLRLSSDVYDGRSIASVAVACHEAGHAVQQATHYAPLVMRSAIVPMAAFAPNLSYLMIVMGLILHVFGLALLGLALFAIAVVAQVVNLPVEFNASARAKQMLPQLGIVSGSDQVAGVHTVLNAAALTYVAGVVSSLMYLLYYAYLVFGRRN